MKISIKTIKSAIMGDSPYNISLLFKKLCETSKSEKAIELLLKNIFNKNIKKGAILKNHDELPTFTLANVSKSLHKELNDRIQANIRLIKLGGNIAQLNMQKAYESWLTSIPANIPTKDQVDTCIASIQSIDNKNDYLLRRQFNDQGHKFVSALSNVIATNNNAIAVQWRAHTTLNYNNREEHLQRDKKYYVIRGSWADNAQLLKGKYYDEITAAGEEINCRCYVKYYYALSRLPDEILTTKGKEYKSSLQS